MDTERLQELINNVDYILAKDCMKNPIWVNLIRELQEESESMSEGSLIVDQLKDKKVLVCDDEPFSRMASKQLLASLGIEVDVA